MTPSTSGSIGTDTGARAASGAYSPELKRDDASLLQFACLLLRRRRLVAALSIGMTVIVLVVTLVLPKKYTTSLSFTPVAMDIPAGALASLAGQFGVNIGGSDPAQTPDFYGTLLQTPDILTKLADTKYSFLDGRDTLSGTFMKFYDIDEGDAGKTMAQAIRVLQSKILTIGYDRQTSIVSVDVKTKWAPLSYQMANRLLELVNDFNLNSRQTQAGQELKFLTQRLDTAQAELRAAENRLQGFVVANRGFATDPTLSFEHDRLQREVNLRQDVYTTLTQAVEQTRLRAVRNTPSVSLVEHPTPALRADRRNTLPKMIGGFAAGLVLAVVWLLVGELLSKGKTETPSDFESLERLWQDTKNDLRRLTFRRPKARAA